MDRADAYGHVHDGGQSRGRDDGHGRDDDGGHYPTDMRRYRNYRIICNLRHCCRGRKRPALRGDDGDGPARERKSVGKGKSVDRGGRRIIKQILVEN